MSPTAKPAEDMLRLPGETTIAWAVLDVEWYQAVYPDTRVITDPALLLRFYLEQGQQRGDSPNPWFDEQWHLATYPQARQAVRDGHAKSGFDSYCRGGFRSCSPHWLFNEGRYRRLHPDLGDDALAAGNHANGYDHYLKHGCREGRTGHPLFDPGFYRSQLAPTETAEADEVGPYLHYLRHAWNRIGERRTTIYFDPLYYKHRYPDVAEAIEQGVWLCALHHYVYNDTPTVFDPLPEFSESDYLARYEDIAAAVASRARRNGYDHFLTNGACELRAPTKWIDLRYYVDAHPSVRADLQSRRASNAFEHYLAIGRGQGLTPAMPPAEQLTEQQARVLYRSRADVMHLTVSRRPLDFTCSEAPAISVIMVQSTALPGALRPIIDLRAHYPGDMQLILVQSGAADAGVLRHIDGARILHFDGELSFVRACNAALHYVTGEIVLFLGIETELMPNAIAAALRRLTSDQRFGAVGAKLIRGDGRLASAGGIIWRDGVTQGYLSDASPTAPEGNFVRAVDFCSTDFLLVRASILRELGGFDEELPAGDLPGADLCIRIAAAGHIVLYDPQVLARQFSQPPAGADATGGNHRGHQHFVRKHRNHLRFRYIPDRRVEVFARSIDHARRILFIDDAIPMRRIGSGFVRSTDIIQTMAALNYGVTVYPLSLGPFGLESLYSDMPDTVEVMHDRDIDGLAAFLDARQGYYDVIWIARTHNLDRVKPLLDRMTAGAGRPPRIVLDTEALSSLRDAGRAAISGDQNFDLDAAIMREFTNAHACQSIIAVNTAEAQRLRDLGFSDVAIIGHMREVRPIATEFAARAGLLFVGAIHEVESPNFDGLNWFIQEILPVVEQSLGWETRLTVAGYMANGISLEQFRDHPRVTLRGPVTNLEKLYASHRIFVAPTRFAAGSPYKVHEAASFGLPVVATDLLRQQLGWDNGADLLSADIADPARFAGHIVTLYRDATLWGSLRDHALERVRAENGRNSYVATLQQVLGP